MRFLTERVRFFGQLMWHPQKSARQHDPGCPSQLAEVEGAPVDLLQGGLDGEARLELQAQSGRCGERELDAGDELFAVAREELVIVAPVGELEAAAPAQRQRAREGARLRDAEAVAFDRLTAEVAVVSAEDGRHGRLVCGR